MIRVLLDQGLAPRAAALLRAAGWDAIHVTEIGLQRADDKEILQAAREDSRVCVTLDHDFHRHLALAQSTGPSAVFIRVEGLGAEAQAALIRRVWETCAEALDKGSAVTVDSKAIRIRKLPLR
jgi:predicted nuclease of predicted toxin-antitoxin system